jgi:hypothetical protein
MIYIEDIEPHFSKKKKTCSLVRDTLLALVLVIFCLLELRRYTWRIIFGICVVLFIIGRCYN